MRAMILKHVLARDTFCPDEDDDEEGQHFASRADLFMADVQA